MPRPKKQPEGSALTATPEQLQAVHDDAFTTRKQLSIIPEMAAARLRMEDDFRRRMGVSRADVLVGLQDAIDDARLQADPKAQIAGWREIGLLLGLYEPTKININVTGTADKVAEQLRLLDNNALEEIMGENILDADFYPVETPRG